MRKAFHAAREQRQPLVACDRYNVKANQLFNIRTYDGVQICWVYPDRVATWLESLSDVQISGVLKGTTPCATCGNMTRFPWFATFFENRDVRRLRNVGILRLTNAQVNLLSNLMAWTVVTSKQTLEEGLN